MSKDKLLFAGIAALASIAAYFATHIGERVQQARPIETYAVERSVTIIAPPAAVLARVADVRYWNDWFAREVLDRKMQERISGPERSPGSTYAWSGNESVGSGRVTIVFVGADRIEAEVK